MGWKERRVASESAALVHQEPAQSPEVVQDAPAAPHMAAELLELEGDDLQGWARRTPPWPRASVMSSWMRAIASAMASAREPDVLVSSFDAVERSLSASWCRPPLFQRLQLVSHDRLPQYWP